MRLGIGQYWCCIILIAVSLAVPLKNQNQYEGAGQLLYKSRFCLLLYVGGLGVTCSPDWPQTHYVAEDSPASRLSSVNLLSLPDAWIAGMSHNAQPTDLVF